MDLMLKGKTAIVTGGSKGIGAGICRAFAKEGVNLIVNCRSDAEGAQQFAEQLKEKYSIRAYVVRADISRAEEVKKLYEKLFMHFQSVDILVNNAAGGIVMKPFQEYTVKEWKDAEEGILDPVFYMSQGFLKYCIGERRGGHIINVLSKSALLSSSIHNLPYVANKGALVSLTRGMAKEFIRYGIYVNGIVPGYVKTEKRHLDGDERTERVRKLLPAKEFATPEEMGNAAVILASPLFRQMIGAVIDCTGGTLI
ncbi:SDR family oxidoreductase [Mediterraneibacter sp. NSJ-55]|uniref:SDR family oxidoreductase n=1 Tax=Mediterraneibacter hominis TaxID=2763054 RepID=A0A923RQI0_9FIRM|nr:SDR family oxidoreductase [Mediterraneibacter hominis]MBC5689521.1 SDR family oxidoreductase [Mediterraneibacter hominis]